MSNDDKGGLGCLIVFFGIALAQQLILLVEQLIPLAGIALAGYIVFSIVTSKNVHKIVSKTFKINEFEEQEKTLELKDGVLLIEQESENDKLRKELQAIKNELQNQKQERQQAIELALKKYAKSIDEKNKSSLLNDVFGNENIEYNRADEYDLQKFSKSKQEIEENLSNRQLKLEMKESLFEAKEDRSKIREELREGFSYLDKRVTTLTGFVTEKFAYQDARITSEISNVKELIGNLRVEIKDQFADFRVAIGKEIVRLDQSMLQVVSKLESYNTRVEKFSYEVKQVKLDAERYNVRSERMLSQAQSLYNNHRADMKVMNKDMEVALSKIAINNESFANKVGEAKLRLDTVSQDQYLTLREISLAQKGLAHGEIGINALREQYRSEFALGEQKTQNLISEKRRIEERIQEKISRSQEVGDLRHKLHMKNESLRHASNQSSLMKQEFAMIKRLTR